MHYFHLCIFILCHFLKKYIFSGTTGHCWVKPGYCCCTIPCMWPSTEQFHWSKSMNPWPIMVEGSVIVPWCGNHIWPEPEMNKVVICENLLMLWHQVMIKNLFNTSSVILKISMVMYFVKLYRTRKQGFIHNC